jgi:eukaryotic-like serine/threonine-protein kinase
MFRQTVKERERVLGQEHANTIDARYWTALSLYRRKKCKDAEAMFRQVVEERERVLGQEHADTIAARYWIALHVSRK